MKDNVDLKGPQITLYIVRHGRTFFNINDQVQGFCDSPLIDDGIAQALKLGESLKEIEFLSAWTSDLGRQRATMKLLLSKNKHKIPVSDEIYGLKEWNFGGFEGGPNRTVLEAILSKHKIDFSIDNYEDMRKKFRQLLIDIGDRGFSDAVYETDKMKRAERYDDVLARAKDAMETIISNTISLCKSKKKKQGNALIVSSGCLIRTLLFTYAPHVYKGGDILNCSVSILKYENGAFNLPIFNDISFIS